MRLVRYGGAMSLDGYIAGPNGEHDWIVMDPEIDFGAMMKQYDTFLIGRKTFDTMGRMGSRSKSTPGIQNVVFSRTLKQADYPKSILRRDSVSSATVGAGEAHAAKASGVREDRDRQPGVRYRADLSRNPALTHGAGLQSINASENFASAR